MRGLVRALEGLNFHVRRRARPNEPSLWFTNSRVKPNTLVQATSHHTVHRHRCWPRRVGIRRHPSHSLSLNKAGLVAIHERRLSAQLRPGSMNFREKLCNPLRANRSGLFLLVT